MNETLAGSLLPVVFAFASLGTVACTADSASSSDVVAREPVAPSAPVEALAGSAKNPIASDAPSLPGASETNAGAALVGMRLVVTEVNSAKPVVYSVHEYDFGLDRGGPLAVIPKDSTRIDSLDVELHGTPSAAGAGGLAAGNAVLDRVELRAGLETSAVCAIYYAGQGSHMDDVRVGVAGPSAPKSSGAESITWDSCLATVKSVEISGTSNEPAREVLKLAAGGLVRTDRPIDPKNGGVVLGQDTKVGWSFVANAPITSCSAVIP